MIARKECSSFGSVAPGRLALLFFSLYVAQGITGSLVQFGLPAILRSSGLRLDIVGLVQVALLPWAFKAAWAPWIDRYALDRLGHRRSWILLAQAGIVLCLGAAALLPPTSRLVPLVVAVFVTAILASTQDIAADALAVDLRRARGASGSLIATAAVMGGYAGYLIAGGVFLGIYRAGGWAWAVAALSLCVLFSTIPAWRARDMDAARPSAIAASRPRLLRTLVQPNMRHLLLFLFVYQAGMRLGSGAIASFLVDMGLPLGDIALLKGTGSIVVGLAAALLGSVLVKKAGASRSLLLAVVLDAALYGALALVAHGDAGGRALIATLILLHSATGALTLVALYAEMMTWCSPRQAGTDFALFQSWNALLTIAGGIAAGVVAQQFGHAANFMAGALVACGGAWAVARFRPRQALGPHALATQE
jgi:MFS transporter (putative signal transducer)